MGLSRRVLADGEEVVSEGHLHWIALVRPGSALLAAVAVLVSVVVAFPGAPVAVAEALAAAVAVVALWTAGRVLRWRSTVVAVTTLRLIERSGVLTRRGEEIRLDRIAELTTRQSLVGMALGFGTLVVDLGAGGRAVLHPVRQPGRLQAVVTDRITAYQRAMSGGGPWSPGWGPPSTSAREPGAPGHHAPAPAWDDEPTAAWGEADRGRWDETDPGRWDDEPTAAWGSAPADRGGDGGRWADAVPQTPPTGTPAVPASLADRLATLHQLYRQGLVTEGEYAAKRAQLLDQL